MQALVMMASVLFRWVQACTAQQKAGHRGAPAESKIFKPNDSIAALTANEAHVTLSSGQGAT
jgi:hypothetical protein